MTIIDPLTYIKAVLAKDFKAPVQPPETGIREEHGHLVITVSRDYGALGETIAANLGRRLGIKVYDKEILDQVAERAGAGRYTFDACDEQPSAGLSEFVYGLVSGTAATLQDYRTHLCEVVDNLARGEAIIIGRAGHLILADKKVFRLRIVGSKLICARRIAEEFAVPFEAAAHTVHEINNKRHQSVRDLFRGSIAGYSLETAKNFDLVINTDHISADAATEIVLFSLKLSGFIAEVPPCEA